LRVLLRGRYLALFKSRESPEPALTIFLMKDGKNDDHVTGDTVIGAVVADAQPVQRRYYTGEPFDPGLDFSIGFEPEAGLSFCKDRRLNGVRELPEVPFSSRGKLDAEGFLRRHLVPETLQNFLDRAPTFAQVLLPTFVDLGAKLRIVLQQVVLDFILAQVMNHRVGPPVLGDDHVLFLSGLQKL